MLLTISIEQLHGMVREFQDREAIWQCLKTVPRGDAMDAAVRRRCPSGVDGLIDAALPGDRVGVLIDAALPGDRAGVLVRDGGPRYRCGWRKPSATRVCAGATSRSSSKPPIPPRWSGWGELLRDGILTPRVAIRLPMSEAFRAHRLVEQGGLRARVVLMLDDEIGELPRSQTRVIEQDDQRGS